MNRILTRYRSNTAAEKRKAFKEFLNTLKNSGILFLFKDKSPFHSFDSMHSEVVTCSCPHATKGIEYWIKSDQSIFCAKCGQLQDPSFWVQPSTLSQLEEAKVINVPAQKDDHSKMEKWKADFLKTMAQYEGKSSIVSIPVKVEHKLLTYFSSKNLIIPGTHPAQRFSKITPLHIRQALFHLDLLKHYDAAHFIYQKLTGKLFVNLSRDEKDLFNDFLLILQLFIKSNMSKTFLQPLYLLQHLLQRRGLLKIQIHVSSLKTHAKLLQQDSMACQLFNLLGWHFQPLHLAMCDDLHNMGLREESL